MNLTRHLRPRLFAVVGVLVVALGVAWQHAGSASAYDDGSHPQDMEQLLTTVTKDVDGYWTKQFAAAGLPEPRVTYDWIPAGQTAASACTGLATVPPC